MSIFGRIKDAILGHPAAAAPVVQPQATAAVAAPQSVAAAPVSHQPIDMVPVLDKMVADKGQHLDWRNSIVDLMKAIDLDSSLDKRKELAHELGFSGDTNDSASMNIWLHKQVMAKLSGEGIKTPA